MTKQTGHTPGPMTGRKVSNPLPLEFCAEYDAAAEHYARRCELPNLMGSPGAYDWISLDPEAFFERVRETNYALAMEGRL